MTFSRQRNGVIEAAGIAVAVREVVHDSERFGVVDPELLPAELERCFEQ